MKQIVFFLALLATLVTGSAVRAEQMAIAAVVNDEAISMTDVQDRIKLVLASSGLPDGQDIRAKITPQVVESLIEEQLKLQAAKKNKLDVTDAEVEDGLKTIAEQNKFSVDQFLQIMERQGVPKQTLVNQIKAQLGWNKVIRETLRRQVEVSDSDVAIRLERLKGKIGQTEYLVSEIYLPLDGKRDAEAQQFASRMAAELQAKKAPFGAVAAQFSKAAGAEKGGSLGWIQEGFLEPGLEKVILALDEGGISDPIKTNNGIYIFHLQKKRTLTEESIPPRDDLTNSIGFERLDRVQQRALLDLKSSAFIDRRV